jgi:hypothetical protein
MDRIRASKPKDNLKKAVSHGELIFLRGAAAPDARAHEKYPLNIP